MEIKDKKNIGEIERRTFTGEVRMNTGEEGEEKRTVEGYAALFNVESQLMWDFVEVIEPGAFDNVLEDDVRALFNHDANLVLARNNGTLELWVDEKGLGYRFEAPRTTVGDDLLENLEKKIITQSSFGFRVEETSWDEIVTDDDSIKHIRRIRKIKELFDVSPVTYPAYLTTEVSLRNFENHKKEKPQNNDLELFEMDLEIQKMK